jgi:hypothetical protein
VPKKSDDMRMLAAAFAALARAYAEQSGIAFSTVVSHYGIGVTQLRMWLESGRAVINADVQGEFTQAEPSAKLPEVTGDPNA